MPAPHPTLETWCPATKEQGLAGSGAPRPTCRRPICPQRRCAPRRRNKGSRGVKHHAQLAGGPSAPKDVVPRDGGTRVRGERSTTPNLPEAHPTPKTWCPATKEQGFAGSEAPRPLSRRLHHSGGAPHSPPAEGSSSSVSPPPPPGWRLSKPATASPMGRRPKSPNQWRGHGVESLGGRRPQQAGTPIRPRRAVSPSDPRDVVPRDEGTRVSGERSTTPNLPETHLRPAPRPAAIAKPVNQKNRELPAGSSRFLSAFAILIFNPVAVQDSFPS